MDRYLQSLRGQIISSRDQSVIMSGDSIIDSIRSHRLRVCDPVSPTPGSSHDGDSIVPFLQSLFGSLDSFPLLSRRRSLGRLS